MTLTGDVGDLYMLWWDAQLKSKLECLSIHLDIFARFKDDVNILGDPLKPGSTFVQDEIVICEKQRKIDENLSDDQITMRVLNEIANSIDEMIKFTVDSTSNYDDKMIPILDLKVGLSPTGFIEHKFYEKPLKNQNVILANSALSWPQKKNIMVQEALRRLLNTNTGPEAQSAILSNFMLKLKRSGYNAKFRQNVVLQAKNKYKKIFENDLLGIRPIYRTGLQIKEDKIKCKNKKWWNKGKRQYASVLFVPATPGGVLAQNMQKRLDQLNPSSVNTLKVVEKGGQKLKDFLVQKNPFPKKICENIRCPVCRETEFTLPDIKKKIPCTTMSVGYRMTCTLCHSQYEGETGRTARARQIGHVNEIRLKNNSNALYKHLVLKHPGQNAKFRVEILKKFMDPLSRQVDEGIRIVKVNPSLILNSKSEFNHPPITRIRIDRRKR